MRMKILITGGSGFIATNFLQYLMSVEEPIDVRIFDLLAGQDLTKWEDVEKAWNWEPDAVVNFASFTHVDESIENPRRYWENNIGLQINVLEACRKYDCRLLQISSSEVYGTAQYVPMDEKHPLCPHSPYSLSKLVQERACYSWWKTYELDVSIVRLFNLFGPYQQRQKLVPKFIYNIVHGLLLPVYAEGKARRDWTYVKDVVNGIWLSLKSLPAGEVVNLCTGKSLSILEISDLLKEIVPRVTGRKDLSKIISTQHVDDRWGHVFHLEGDNRRAKELLDWEPKYTLDQALEETVRWYVANDSKEAKLRCV